MCGIVGLMGTSHAAEEAFFGLTTLQHRGQDAAGILSHDVTGFHSVKNVGLVESVFHPDSLKSLKGTVAIGHARYSTIGKGDLLDVQPLLLNYPFGIGMVHNGNIVNCAELSQELKVKGRRHLLTHSDTEVILNLFAEGLAQFPADEGSREKRFEHVCAAVGIIFQKVKGSYSVLTLIAEQGLVAFRDPFGIRPLVLGKKKRKDCGESVSDASDSEGACAYLVASESVALSFLGYDYVRDVEPGEVLLIHPNGEIDSRILDRRSSRHCMFEWVYFASPESVIDQIPVYRSRIQLGKALGKRIAKEIAEKKIEVDLIVPVPETARIAAIALAEWVQIPYREVLIKNRYIKRTFLLDSQEKRQKAVHLKLSPIRSEIEGKKVLLVDDSVVRGTTSKKIIELIRNAGASKVYLVSTCPPIRYPCYYGIDFPNQSELIAYGRNLARIEKDLGADAVIYQDLVGLEESILVDPMDTRSVSSPPLLSCSKTSSRRSAGFKKDLCLACLNGQYPTDISAALQFTATREVDRKACS